MANFSNNNTLNNVLYKSFFTLIILLHNTFDIGSVDLSLLYLFILIYTIDTISISYLFFFICVVVVVTKTIKKKKKKKDYKYFGRVSERKYFFLYLVMMHLYWNFELSLQLPIWFSGRSIYHFHCLLPKLVCGNFVHFWFVFCLINQELERKYPAQCWKKQKSVSLTH